MSKIISLTIGLLAVTSIAPNSEAMSANIQPSSLQQPAENLHSQIIFRSGDSAEPTLRERGYTHREEWQYRRDLRRQQRRWERRNGEYNRGGYNRGEYNRNDGYNRGEYNRNGRYNRGEYNRNDGYNRNRY